MSLGGELKGFVDGDSRDGSQHGNEQLLDADVIMGTAIVVLGTSQPENPNVPTQLGIFPVAGEFRYRRCGDRVIGMRGDVFSVISGCHKADQANQEK